MVPRKHVVAASGGVAVALLGIVAIQVFRSQPPPRVRIAAVIAAETTLGTSVRQGLELALRTVHAEWPAGEVELLLRDSGGSPEAACAQLDELIAGGVTMLTEVEPELLSGCIRPIRSDGMVMVSGLSGGARLGELLGPRFFSLAAPTGQTAGELASWARELRVQRPVIFHGPSPAELALRDEVVQGWGGLSERLCHELSEPGDVAAAWSSVEPLDPDAVFVFLEPALAAEVLARTRELGPKLLGLESPLGGEPFRAAARGADLSRVFFLTGGVLASTESSSRAEVAAAWRTAFGRQGEPEPEVLLAYDALHTLAQAVREAGGAGDPERVVAALRSVRRMGASGPLAFEGNARFQDVSFQRRAYGPDGQPRPYEPRWER